MTIYSPLDPVANQGMLYVNGLQISNNATTPNTKIDIAPGLCRDSTDTFDINLGNWYGAVPTATITANTTTTINAATSGALGLDTGTFAASKVYYVHVIFDNTMNLAPSALISLSRTAPTLPAGYSNFRWIGQMMTDASTHFLLGYNYGQNSDRTFVYDSPQATSVTAGTSATYAAIVLTTLVPTIDQTPVLFKADWTANAAGDTFNMQGGNATGDQWTMIAPVAGGTAHTVGFGTVMSQLVAGVATSNYKVSAVGGVAINVAGFSYSL